METKTFRQPRSMEETLITKSHHRTIINWLKRTKQATNISIAKQTNWELGNYALQPYKNLH